MDKKILISIALCCTLLDLVTGTLELKEVDEKQAIGEMVIDGYNDGHAINEMP